MATPYGAIIGAGLGGLAGGAAGVSQQQASKKGLKKQIANQILMQGEIGDKGTQRINDLASMYAPLIGENMAGNLQSYQDLLKNADYSKYDISSPEEFQYIDEDGNPLTMEELTQQSMNPMIQDIIDRASGAVSQSAANRGSLFSGAAGKALARSTADIQADQYGKASDIAQQKYQNKYGAWKDKFDMSRLAIENNRQNQSLKAGDMGKLVGIQTDAYGNQITAQQGVTNAMDTAQLQARQAQLDAEAQNAGLQSAWGAALSGALGGASKGATVGSGMDATK